MWNTALHAHHPFFSTRSISQALAKATDRFILPLAQIIGIMSPYYPEPEQPADFAGITNKLTKWRCFNLYKRSDTNK
jgi:hypothetical protein